MKSSDVLRRVVALEILRDEDEVFELEEDEIDL